MPPAIAPTGFLLSDCSGSGVAVNVVTGGAAVWLDEVSDVGGSVVVGDCVGLSLLGVVSSDFVTVRVTTDGDGDSASDDDVAGAGSPVKAICSVAGPL